LSRIFHFVWVVDFCGNIWKSSKKIIIFAFAKPFQGTEPFPYALHMIEKHTPYAATAPTTETATMVTILGPTASGKTQLAAHLAARINGEIVSADSRQVYRGMDIGTGKDLADYVVDGRTIPYHLIDVCEAGTRYNLFRYQQDAREAIADIAKRGQIPILCGGTGLYIESLLKGYNLSPVPQNAELRAQLADKSLTKLTEMLHCLKARNGSHMHNTTDVDTPQRAIRAIEIELAVGTSHKEHKEQGSTDDKGSENQCTPLPRSASIASGLMHKAQELIFGINIDRNERRERITRRLKQRLDEGMVEEISGLLARGIAAEDLLYYGLEYRYITEYVLGRLTREEMFTSLETAIHQFAKRQMTWFRGMERRGFTIRWIDYALPMEEKLACILEQMKQCEAANTGNNHQTT